MEVFYCEEHLASVKPGTPFGKTPSSAQMKKQFPTLAELKDEEKFLGRLEGEVQSDNERVVDRLQNVSLRLRVLHLIALHDVLLSEHLHCVDPSPRETSMTFA